MERQRAVSFYFSRQLGSSVSDGALELLQQMTSDMNRSRRESFPISPLLAERAEIVWQVKSWHRIFEIGSPRLIHGKIRTR